MLLPARGPRAEANLARAGLLPPWLFLAPALAARALFLAWPVLATGRLSLRDRSGEGFTGLADDRALAADPKFAAALRKTLMWPLVAPAGAAMAADPFRDNFSLMAVPVRNQWG